MNQDDVASRPPSRTWVRAEDYVEALARRRTARRSRGAAPRTQPEKPRLLLSTLPFAALIVGVAVLTLSIIVAAWPHAPQSRTQAGGAPELGTAAKGWFQDAEKDFRRSG
jgi:hypothetical protein